MMTLLLLACTTKDIKIGSSPWPMAEDEYGPLPFVYVSDGDALDMAAYTTVEDISNGDVNTHGAQCEAVSSLEITEGTSDLVVYEGDCDTGWDTSGDTAECHEVYDPAEWHWYVQGLRLSPLHNEFPEDAAVPSYANIIVARNYGPGVDATPTNGYSAGSACLSSTCSTGGSITGVDNAWEATWSADDALQLDVSTLGPRAWLRAMIAGYGTLSLFGQPIYHNDSMTAVLNVPRLTDSASCNDYNGQTVGEAWAGGVMLNIDWAEPGELMFWAPTDPECDPSAAGTFTYTLWPWSLVDLDDNNRGTAAFMLVPGAGAAPLPANAWITGMQFSSVGSFSGARFYMQRHGYGAPILDDSDALSDTARVTRVITSGANVITSGAVNGQAAILATGVRLPSSGQFARLPTVQVTYECATWRQGDAYVVDVPQGYRARISDLSSRWSHRGAFAIIRPDFPDDTTTTEADLWFEPEGYPSMRRNVRMSDPDGDGTWDWAFTGDLAGVDLAMTGTVALSGESLQLDVDLGSCGAGCGIEASSNTLSKYE